MRGRRGSRSAAVVLAGCVGLAVMAPGLALAAPISGVTTPEACATAGGTWKVATETCDDGTPSGSTTGSSGSGSGVGNGVSSSAPSTTTTTEAPANTGAGTTAGSGVAGTGTGAAARNSGTSSESSTSTTTTTTATAPDATAGDTAADAQQTQAGLTRLQKVVDDQTGATDATAALLPQDALDALTGALGFEIPTAIPAGGFTNPQESCAYLASQLQVPSGVDAVGLAGQLGQFCTTLPTSALDPSALTGLIQHLIDVLKGLIPSLPTPPATIPTTPPQTVSPVYWGYWYHQYDVDCPELTYEEANAILAADPSDPFRLDGDHDGVACEENAHGDGVAYVEYDGYPVGGVATGDGSTDTGASGVEVALAAATLAGLGVTGLVLVRRFARQG